MCLCFHKAHSIRWLVEVAVEEKGREEAGWLVIAHHWHTSVSFFVFFGVNMVQIIAHSHLVRCIMCVVWLHFCCNDVVL